MECVTRVCAWLGAGGTCGGEWVTGLDLGYTNSGGKHGESGICFCVLVAVVWGGVGGEWVGGLGQGRGGWGPI